MENHDIDIVRKLWNLCHVLRDDGISYQNYINELTFILFPKMLAELDRESELPAKYFWKELIRKDGTELHDHYRQMLLDLGKSKNPKVAAIYRNASTSIRQPTHLHKIVSAIDELDWHSTVGFGGSMIWFGSSAGVALANILRPESSLIAWSDS